MRRKTTLTGTDSEAPDDGNFGAQDASPADEEVKGAADAEEQSAVAFQHRISRSRGRGKKRRRGEEEEEYD